MREAQRDAEVRIAVADTQVSVEEELAEMYRLLDEHHRVWTERCVFEEMVYQGPPGWCVASTEEMETVVRERWTEEWQQEIKSAYRAYNKRGNSRADSIRLAYEDVCRLRSVARVGVLPATSWGFEAAAA